MSDLISRSEAIQRLIQETIDSKNNLIHINTAKRLLQDVDTAYDIDKVVEELENMKTICGAGVIVGGDYIHRNETIEIVKQGGVADECVKKLVWYRFKTKSVDDYRPLIDMKDIQMPWWRAGTALDDSYVVIVCYLPKGEDLYKYWDDAYDVESADRTKIRYTDRFPKPDWIKEVEQMEAYKCDVCGCYCDDVYRLDSDVFDIYPNDKVKLGIKEKNRTEVRDMCYSCFGKIKEYIHGMCLKRLKESD